MAAGYLLTRSGTQLGRPEGGQPRDHSQQRALRLEERRAEWHRIRQEQLAQRRGLRAQDLQGRQAVLRPEGCQWRSHRHQRAVLVDLGSRERHRVLQGQRPRPDEGRDLTSPDLTLGLWGSGVGGITRLDPSLLSTLLTVAAFGNRPVRTPLLAFAVDACVRESALRCANCIGCNHAKEDSRRNEGPCCSHCGQTTAQPQSATIAVGSCWRPP
jgi:hypothetical protein